MAIVINLPNINGEIEAGITVGVDAALPDDKKLPILRIANRPATHEMIKTNAAIWAYRQFNDPDARKLLVTGVACLLDLGMVGIINNTPDGDWLYSNNQLKPEEGESAALQAMCTVAEMQKSVSIAVATKASFWATNHHTGQGAVQGYVKKILEVFYKDRVTDVLVEATYNLGHYASTLIVLNAAQIPGIRLAQAVTRHENASLKFTQDALLRFSSLPAGTHRLGAAYESAKRLARSIYAPFCPNVADFKNIPPIRELILADRAKYHIGASYLTGANRADYSDTDMENYLGRLGTFINVLYKNSTLAKSPHLMVAKVESYEDYDAAFKQILINLQTTAAQERARMAREQMEAIAFARPEDIAELKNLFTVAPIRLGN